MKEMLQLKIRSLIADKEMATATANLDLARGGQWQCDYNQWHRELNYEIEELMEKLREL